MKLYEINEALENLLELDENRYVDVVTGEILLLQQVEELKLERDEKIEGCLLYAKNKTAEAKAIKDEIDRLSARMQTCENDAKRARSCAQKILAGEKFKTTKVAVHYTTSKSVDYQGDINELPKEYLRIKIDLNKTAIGEALKAGIEIKGASLIENKSMVVK